jgi:hypothetical protein
MQSWEQYEAYYRRTGRLINDIGPRSNELTDRGLRARYERYVKSNERKVEKVKQKEPPTTYGHFVEGKPCLFIERLKQNSVCFLSKTTSLGTLDDLYAKAPQFMLEKIDPAHIFSRGADKAMHENPDNIIPLNRYSHGMIDIWKHPIFGTPITDEERDEFWCILIGYTKYEELEKLSKEKNR